jgi:hypothetical protein
MMVDIVFRTLFRRRGTFQNLVKTKRHPIFLRLATGQLNKHFGLFFEPCLGEEVLFKTSSEAGVLTILLQYYWSQNNNTIIEGEIYF